ncbi:hypothetical protein EVAR_41228_1 [Eumeta japonica]|uniref:Uncharacterized protein n=1 Tax=Eumeta variegata TaxID=151549 RepID=A0A4C1W754_EUMVA|nr:hypothetical protein EVAR_41228_1 [Eumeta japonica]
MSDGEGSRLSELSVTGQNASTVAATSRLHYLKAECPGAVNTALTGGGGGGGGGTGALGAGAVPPRIYYEHGHRPIHPNELSRRTKVPRRARRRSLRETSHYAPEASKRKFCSLLYSFYSYFFRVAKKLANIYIYTGRDVRNTRSSKSNPFGLEKGESVKPNIVFRVAFATFLFEQPDRAPTEYLLVFGFQIKPDARPD